MAALPVIRAFSHSWLGRYIAIASLLAGCSTPPAPHSEPGVKQLVAHVRGIT